MDRRQFVVSSAAATAAGLLRVDLTRHAAPINPIGVQLFSVPMLLERAIDHYAGAGVGCEAFLRRAGHGGESGGRAEAEY